MLKIFNSEVPITLFPDNTSQVWKLNSNLLNCEWVDVHWNFQTEAEFMQLAQLKWLLNEMNVEANLYLSYLPYGRQDKEVSNVTTFALKPFADLLNYLKFNKVYCLDPHSVTADLLIKNFVRLPIVEYVNKAIDEIKPTTLAYPDQGARDKYELLFNQEFVSAEKVRDQSSGNITELKFRGWVDSKKVLIIDDICDGGKTFVEFAKQLYGKGAESVHLYVTHGIFSKGFSELKDANIKSIYTKDGKVL